MFGCCDGRNVAAIGVYETTPTPVLVLQMKSKYVETASGRVLLFNVEQQSASTSDVVSFVPLISSY